MIKYSSRSLVYVACLLVAGCAISCKNDKASSMDSAQLFSEVSYRVASIRNALIVYRANNGNLPDRLDDLRDDPSLRDDLGKPLYDAMIWTLENQGIQYDPSSDTLCVFLFDDLEASALKERNVDAFFVIKRAEIEASN